MLDYAAWLQRAVAFTEALSRLSDRVEISVEVAPTLTAQEVERLSASCGLPIPESLRRFWATASGRSRCTYRWELPSQFHRQAALALSTSEVSANTTRNRMWWLNGGAEFESPDEIVESADCFPDWAESFRDNGYPRDARFWQHSISLLPFGNGDFLGLYLEHDVIDPPVVYLCHEGCGASRIIAGCLDAFLTSWEQIGYIGLGAIHRFLNRRTGYLDPLAFPVETEAIRSLFRGEIRTDLVKPSQELTEREWMSSGDPESMLDWLEKQGKLSERRLRLFCCACCRRVWDRLGEWSKKAVEVSERFADGLASAAELALARDALSGGDRGSALNRDMTLPGDHVGALVELLQDPAKGMNQGPLKDVLDRFTAALHESSAFSKSQGLMHRAAYSAVDAQASIVWEIAQHLDEPELQAEQSAQADLVRHLFGNPFQPAMQLDAGMAPKLVELANRAYACGHSGTELHDALIDAGRPELAEHFVREDHPKGCWALDLILGR